MPDMRPPHLHPLRWLGQRDRGFAALRRATRAAIIMPSMFALGDKVIGNPQLATFAAFGSFAMLILVDFGGPMAERLQAEAALVIVGAMTTIIAPNKLHHDVNLSNISSVRFFVDAAQSA